MLIEFEGKTPRIGKNVFIAPTAVLIGDIEVGDDTSIWFGAVLRGDFGPIRIGVGCNIQDNVTVHVFGDSPTILHDRVTIGHGAALEGCQLGHGTLVGMNATVLPFAIVGERVVVAAGCVIPERADIPDHVLVAGVPAEVKKKLSGAALQWTTHAAGEYLDMQTRYRTQPGSLPTSSPSET